MNKLLIALLAGLCCGSSYAQSAPAPAPAAAASITFPVAPAPAAGATVAGLPVSTMIPVGSGSMPSAPAPGLYVAVVAGSIHFSNPAGSTAFAAGQFGFTASPTAPPMIIPSSPGHAFTPPPSFSFTGMGFPVFGSAGSTGSGSKTESIDCEVR